MTVVIHSGRGQEGQTSVRRISGESKRCVERRVDEKAKLDPKQITE